MSNDEKHAPKEAQLLETLTLLEEVSAYMKRLPNVPMTTELVRKIDEHIQNPEVVLARRLAQNAEAQRGLRIGGIYNGVGYGLVLVEVATHSLRVMIPENAIWDSTVLHVLRQGREIPLGKPRVEPPRKFRHPKEPR